MRSPFCFIAEPVGGNRYDSVSDSGIVLSASQEDHTATNRMAKVISVPVYYKGPVVPGDTLLVHHNTFRKYYDMKGRERNGPSYFRDNMYFIFDDQYFMYKHDDVWMAPDPYCFIRPTEEPLMGEIAYINTEMLAMGMEIGDIVSFQPESEYEFNIDGEKLYRMFTKNICLTKI